MRSAYFWRIRSASALRFSNGCSSLNFARVMAADVIVWYWCCSGMRCSCCDAAARDLDLSVVLQGWLVGIRRWKRRVVRRRQSKLRGAKEA